MSTLISIITRQDIHAETVRWALDAAREPDVEIDIFQSFMPIDANRNKQVERFLATEHSHIFFLDSDAVPIRGTIPALLSMDKDAAIGPNFIFTHGARTINYMVYDDPWPEEGRLALHFPEHGQERIDGSGMSGLLVRREVFERIEAPWFRFVYEPETGRILIGEDVYFYRKLADAGIEVWADYALACHHYKTTDLKDLFDAQQTRTVGFESHAGKEPVYV